MNPFSAPQPDAHLAAILQHVHALRRCNLSLETDRSQALDESRRLLGAIAQFRHGLRRRPPASARRTLRAA